VHMGACVLQIKPILRLGDMTLLVRYEGDKTRGAGKLDYRAVLS
jgi:hypothetical protein